MSTYLMDLFKKENVKNSSSIKDYISLISSKGDFNKITDFDVIVNSWNTILMTPSRSYVFDPEFGSELYKYVFEPADEITSDQIKDEISYKLSKYDNRAQILGIDVNFFTNQKGFSVSVKVSWKSKIKYYEFTIDEKIANLIASQQTM